MDKREALAIFAREIIRELLRDDDAPAPVVQQPSPPPEDSGPGWAQPAFDFDQSNDVCEHGGVWVPKATCPVHGPGADVVPTPEELDDMASDETPAMIARAQRLREAQEKRAQRARQFPEDLPLRGMGPPPEDE